jgi:serine/threonine-protein kinase
LPASLRGFNWAAFILGPVWGLGNAVVPAILIGIALWIVLWVTYTTVPVAGVAAVVLGSLLIGYRGNEWAWRARKWQSGEQFRRVQQGWLLWAVVVAIIWVVMALLLRRGPDA